MATNYHQLSLIDTFSDCNDMFMDDVPSFFQLLEQHLAGISSQLTVIVAHSMNCPQYIRSLKPLIV